MKAKVFVLTFTLVFAVMVTPAFADLTLQVTEHQITSSSAMETTPTIGNDNVSDLVVFTVLPLIPPGPADIWYQRLDANGAPDGLARQVTSAVTDDQLNDISGDYIVYTAYDSVTSISGAIMLYQISTRELQELRRATIIQEARIHDRYVVWREGGDAATQIMLYNLDWLGTPTEPITIAGPVPTTYDVQISDRYVLWTQRISNQWDIVAYDLEDAMCFPITNTADVDEIHPATSGPWVVWRAQVHGALTSTIEGVNLNTLEMRVIVDNGAWNSNPSIDGDLVTWYSNVNGTCDVYVCTMQTGEIWRVTADPADQYLSDVFGDLVAYVDTRGLSEDVYVSKLEFYLPGDVDGDFDVDIVDVVKITSIYGSKQGDLEFNPDSDLDGDGAITILDVVICTSHYGDKWP